MDNIVRKAYGKINLGLDVIRKREDGYHEVRMIMQTVGLYDLLKMRKTSGNQITMHCNLSFLPVDERNLVYRAVQIMKEKYGLEGGVEIDLQKRIPVAAGMAGGSTDCAAALHGMNELFDLKLSKEELCEIGVTLGADVPYCIWGGTALSEGIGEKLTKIAPMPECQILIVKPGISVSTGFVYQNLKLSELLAHPDIDGMIKCLEEQDLEGICGRLENVLETVTISEYPVIEKIKNYLMEQGAMGTLMSGSGPTIFGIFQERSTAEKAKESLRDLKEVKQAYVVKPIQ